MSLKTMSKCAFFLSLVCLIFALPACSGSGGAGGSSAIPPPGSNPQADLWLTSGHADALAEAFTQWDATGEIPASCAKCHSAQGFLDFLGDDGTAERVVDNPVTIDPTADNVLDCDTCHNGKTYSWDTVIFPSAVEITGLGREAFCMECHQGRESTVSVDDLIANAAPADDDTVDPDLSFVNVHYFAAAATQYGGTTMGGYQYSEQLYDIKFAHVPNVNTCVVCHEPHSLDIVMATCSQCHSGLTNEASLANIRMEGSERDYDGDGNMTEGIPGEIGGLRIKLSAAIRAYASDVIGTDIAYDANTPPHFFNDTNGNGVVDPAEATGGNAYSTWTSRLVRAAYNYQFSVKDPGNYTHNGKYVIELVYDSITDVNSALAPPSQIAMTGTSRIDAGHFAGSEEAFRHWDADGAVSSSCSRCHSATGLAYYVQNGTTQSEPISNGFLCSTCHDEVPNFNSQLTVAQVTFPGTIVVDSGDNTTNICMTCHQGRSSKSAVDTKVLGMPEDTVNSTLTFSNVHYFAAGATRYGTEVKVGYEYDGESYDGLFPHVEAFSTCNSCHDTHSLLPRVEACGACHVGVVEQEDIWNIRMAGSTNDYNGNANTTEGISYEISVLRDQLYAAIQTYAATNPGSADIVYDGATNPYFFIDTNGNGVVDAGENVSANKYNTWTPRILKAAYNLQFTLKDPGCSAHNAKYAIELLYDSIANIGGDVTTLARNDSGHFDTTTEAFRHWDEDGVVSGSCSRCHAPPGGFDYYLQNGVDSPGPMPVSYGLTCETCHTGADFAGNAPRKYVNTVTFPGGVVITNTPADPDDSFLCMTCHQGRESKATIDAAIGAGSLSFKNVHYLGAGATIYGSVAVVGYQYDGKTYDGKFNHFTPSSARCSFCHEVTADRHVFLPKLETSCKDCHAEAVGDDIETIRMNRAVDYDGDGNNTEKLKDEIGALAAAVLSAIQSHASNVVGVDIAYDPVAYPYFFIDTNGNGVVDPGEGVYSNRFTAWDAALMKAAHNYQHSQKEPGTWAHNTDYIAQLLIDSIEDLGEDVSGFNRP